MTLGKRTCGIPVNVLVCFPEIPALVCPRRSKHSSSSRRARVALRLQQTEGVERGMRTKFDASDRQHEDPTSLPRFLPGSPALTQISLIHYSKPVHTSQKCLLGMQDSVAGQSLDHSTQARTTCTLLMPALQRTCQLGTQHTQGGCWAAG